MEIFTQPIIFHGLPELLNNFPESDIAIATFWTTAPWVTDIVKLVGSRQEFTLSKTMKVGFILKVTQANVHKLRQLMN